MIAIAAAFIGGAVTTVAVILGVAWLTMRTDPSASGGTPAPDGGQEQAEEQDPLFTCEYHDQSFYDEDEAHEHARQYHNAPRDGDTWKHTYPEGRE